MNKQTITCLAALAACTVLATGCATMKPSVSAAFSAPDQLHVVDDKGTLAFRRAVQPGVVFAMPVISPVVIDAEMAAAAKLSPEAAAGLAKVLEAELTRAVATRWSQVVPEGTVARRVRVDTRVTALNLSNGKMNAVTVLALGVPADPGGIVVEIEAVDAGNAERLVVRIAGRGGKPFNLLSSLRRTGQAELGFRHIAADFADDLVGTLAPAAGAKAAVAR